MSLRYPDEVPGWLFRAQGHRLAELARGRRVLEVGTFCGKSLLCMAQTAQVVHTVDFHVPHHDHDSLPECWGHLDRYGLRDRVVLHVGPTDAVLPALADGQFDFGFHDASHDREQVVRDLRQFRRLLKPGSLLAVHDAPSQNHPGPWQALVDCFGPAITLEQVGCMSIVAIDAWTAP